MGQTGAIPLGTQTIEFWGALGGMQVSFAGQPLSFAQIGSGPTYGIYGADVFAFAGETGELLFTVPPNTGGSLDNIQFSTSPVPEPNSSGLFAVGGLFVAWRLWRKGLS